MDARSWGCWLPEGTLTFGPGEAKIISPDFIDPGYRYGTSMRMKEGYETFIAIFAAAFCLSCFSQAQSENELITETDADISSGDRTFRIFFPERPNSSPKTAYLFDGKESQLVSLPSMSFSKVMELPKGERTITLSPSKITDPKNIPPEAPQLTVKASVHDFYILISPDRANPTLPLQIRLINISDEELKPGQTLWMNLTDHQITVEVVKKTQ